MRRNPNIRAVTLFKIFRDEVDITAYTGDYDEAGHLKPREADYPTINQMRATIQRMRTKDIEFRLAKLDDLGWEKSPVGRAKSIVETFRKDGIAKLLDLGFSEYYDVLAFSLPQFDNYANPQLR